jgi:hypothetical protein
LYNVWEAKKFSELSPTIGERTLAFVVEPGFTLKSGDGRRSPGLLTAAGAEFLDRQYKRYGRRTVPADFSLPSDSFQDPH